MSLARWFTALVARLKADVMRLATAVTGHEFWSSLSGPEQVEARTV
ncbi:MULTISPECIES: hypothetical protein [unclassified Streptomyces]|nr:hypothetical protein [Streptomyces sp. CB01635]